MDDDNVTFGVSKDADKICSSRMIIWKAVNVVMAIFFLLCALAQVNDPDPYIWTPIYLVPCLLTAVVTFRKNTSESPAWKWLLTIHIAACLVGIVYLTILVLELMNGQYKDNPLSKEEGRELAGLLTVVVWLSICRFCGFNEGLNKPPLKATVLLCMAVVIGLTPLLLWSLCLVEGMSSLGHCADML